MIIEWPEWRVKSYEHGYQVQRLTGKTRWVAQSYHGTLAQAVDSLLQYRIRVETENHTIVAIDKASAASGTAKLVEKIESITAEVLEGVNKWN